MYKKQIIMIIFVFICLINTVYSKDCGGTIECNCGDTVVEDYIMKDNLICNNNGLKLESQVTLNCQGHYIKGNHSFSGLIFKAESNSDIKNCNIMNFANGVTFKSKKRYSCILGRCHVSGYYKPEKNKFYNNKFINNTIGMKLGTSGYYNKIYNNQFINNKEHGIYLKSNDIIYNNTFIKTGIFFPVTGSYKFCHNGYGNDYFKGAIGPKCDCIVLYDNLRIKNDVNICPKKYYLKNGIIIGNKKTYGLGNVKINCNNAQIIGNNTNTGIIFQGVYNSQISNCNIRNYNTGININNYKYRDSYNWRKKHSTKIRIINNSILNNSRGIYCKNKNHISEMHNNILLSGNYNLVNKDSYYTINATNNWWGFNNKTKILNTIDNITDNIIIEPFLTYKQNLSDLEINEIFIDDDNNNINFNVKNSFSILNSEFKVKIIQVSEHSNILQEDIITINKTFDKNQVINIKTDIELSSIVNNVKFFLDYNNKINEIDEFNNFKNFNVRNNNKYYLNVNIKPYVLNDIITNFLIKNINSNYLTKNKNKANVVININSNFKKNDKLLNKFFTSNVKPYNGYIKSKLINDNTIINISAYGDSGYVAIIKYFILNINDFIDINNKYEINATNINAINIYDAINKINYENKEYKKLIKNILNNEFYTINKDYVDIYSKEGIINYRIWNLKSKKSNKLKSFMDKKQYPIVFSGGIFSNITAWKSLGEKLAQQGYNVYLIEMTGGTNSECKNCYNYNYTHLTKNVFPGYIDYILEDSGRDKIIYIGHSNGCRTALSSIDLNYVDSYFFDKFIGVACPVSLNDKTLFTKLSRKKNLLLKKSGNYAIEDLRSKNITHVEIDDYLKYLLGINNVFFHPRELILLELFTDNNKISLNLMDFYNKLSINHNSGNPFQNISLNEIYLYNIHKDDFILGVDEMNKILDKSNYNNKENTKRLYHRFPLTFIKNHVSIKNNKDFINDFMEDIK